MDAGGEALEHEMHGARVALNHVHRVRTSDLEDGCWDQCLDCALTGTILEQTERAEEVAAAVQGDDQLAALLIVQEGFCEAVIDDEGVTWGIAPVVHNLASAK